MRSGFEARVEALEKQLLFMQKSVPEAVIEYSGPAEIRTPDLRRVNTSAMSDVNTPANATSKDYSTLPQESCSDLQAFWQYHETGFHEWLQHRDISKQTKQSYINALSKFFESNNVHKPNDFRKFELKDKESRGLRNLFNYCEDEEIGNVEGHPIEKWRRFIKIKRSGVTEIYITDEEIRKAYNSCPRDIRIIFKLLVCSGSRFSHLYKMLQSFDESNVVVDGEIAH